MTKEVWYRYLGTNGVINSPVHLEDIYYVRLIKLQAGLNKVLTNGEQFKSSVTVPEEEVDNWQEVDAVNLD